MLKAGSSQGQARNMFPLQAIVWALFSPWIFGVWAVNAKEVNRKRHILRGWDMVTGQVKGEMDVC